MAIVSVRWIAARLAASWGPGGWVIMCATAWAVSGDGIILEITVLGCKGAEGVEVEGAGRGVGEVLK